MVYYALSARIPQPRRCPILLAMKMTQPFSPPLRGQRYSVMPVNDPTIDIGRIDRHAAPRRAKLSRAERSRAEPGQARLSRATPSHAEPFPIRTHALRIFQRAFHIK